MYAAKGQEKMQKTTGQSAAHVPIDARFHARPAAAAPTTQASTVPQTPTIINTWPEDQKLQAYKFSILFKEFKESPTIDWYIQQGYLDENELDEDTLAAIFAIRRYTQADFSDINKLLWKLNNGNEIEWDKKDFVNMNKLKNAFNKTMQLQEAYQLLLAKHGETLDCYRFEDSSRAAEWAARKVGDTYTFKGFMSTTLSPEKPKAIAGNDGAVKIKIIGQHGLRLYGELTAHEGEEEFLLQPGITFTVQKVDHAKQEYEVKS